MADAAGVIGARRRSPDAYGRRRRRRRAGAARAARRRSRHSRVRRVSAQPRHVRLTNRRGVAHLEPAAGIAIANSRSAAFRGAPAARRRTASQRRRAPQRVEEKAGRSTRAQLHDGARAPARGGRGAARVVVTARLLVLGPPGAVSGDAVPPLGRALSGRRAHPVRSASTSRDGSTRTERRHPRVGARTGCAVPLRQLCVSRSRTRGRCHGERAGRGGGRRRA